MLVTVRRRAVVRISLLLVLLVITALVGAPGRAAFADPPPSPGPAPSNPSNQQLSGASKEKADLAARVGQLSAQVAQQENQLRQLQAAQEMAEQKLAYALQQLDEAKQASRVAAKAVVDAQRRVDAAQRQFEAFVQSTYMSGSIGGTTGSLLTAPDPSVVLQQGALEQYESDHQLDAIGAMKTASVAKSNADARARAAVKRQREATQAAAQAKDEAVAAVTAAQAQQRALQASLAANQGALQQAQERLATLNHQRAAYLAYQQKLAAWRAYQRHLAEVRAARARAAALAAARARAAAEAAAARRHHHPHHGGGGFSGGGGGGAPAYTPPPAPAPSGGGWSPARGHAAVHRAMAYLGWMYAWAGGNASGPTYGVCAGDGAFNDCHVQGFDCSGLALYAWAPYEYLPHLAMAQYSAAGSFHPSLGNLRPGDLVFWSSNGSVSGIHHVAIYIGNGNVIQAPESGSVIQITPLMSVDWGLFGATRPLT